MFVKVVIVVSLRERLTHAVWEAVQEELEANAKKEGILEMPTRPVEYEPLFQEVSAFAGKMEVSIPRFARELKIRDQKRQSREACGNPIV